MKWYGKRERKELIAHVLYTNIYEIILMWVMFVIVLVFSRVGIQLPTIEVKYENLTVDAKCVVGSRALPTLKNVTINILEVLKHSSNRLTLF